MKASKLALPVLPALALGAAALLVNPATTEVYGFNPNGDSLNPGQRDFRLNNTFADAQANNNTEVAIWWPGWDGAELAIWKGVGEWGSVPHGNGSGDPTQNNVGDGGANFDSAWMGNATGNGGINDNVISPIASCGAGILAFAEPPYSNGWRVRFCEAAWIWNDGPGNPGFQQDIQGIMTHEYGHCLGLNHTGVGGATMFASTGGGPGPRSIAPDDIAGVQFIYGVREPTKATICETAVSGSTLTITGRNFDAVDNDVWFCPTAATPGNVDPRIRLFGVASTSNRTVITVTIPAGVSAGDVLVKRSDSGGASLSNAFPMNLTGTLSVACPYSVASISPATMDPLDPGTAQSVTLTGFELDDTLTIDLNGNSVSSSNWTIVDPETITIDMPLGLLGSNTLTCSSADNSYSIDFTVTEPASPLLELGDGEPTFTVANGGTMNMVVAGEVGSVHHIYYSNSNLPSTFPKGMFLIGNNFTHFPFAALFAIGSEGYTQFTANITFGGGSPMTFYSQSIDITTPPAPNFGISNLQTITLTP